MQEKPRLGKVVWVLIAVGVLAIVMLAFGSGLFSQPDPPTPLTLLIKTAICDRIRLEEKTYIACDDNTMWLATPLTEAPQVLQQ